MISVKRRPWRLTQSRFHSPHFDSKGLGMADFRAEKLNLASHSAMNLSEISIRRPVFAWMLMFGLIVFGAISFQRMGISMMPDVNFPVVNIALRLDNAAPEVMEMDVIDPIE